MCSQKRLFGCAFHCPASLDMSTHVFVNTNSYFRLPVRGFLCFSGTNFFPLPWGGGLFSKMSSGEGLDLPLRRCHPGRREFGLWLVGGLDLWREIGLVLRKTIRKSHKAVECVGCNIWHKHEIILLCVLIIEIGGEMNVCLLSNRNEKYF